MCFPHPWIRIRDVVDDIFLARTHCKSRPIWTTYFEIQIFSPLTSASVRNAVYTKYQLRECERLPLMTIFLTTSFSQLSIKSIIWNIDHFKWNKNGRKLYQINENPKEVTRCRVTLKYVAVFEKYRYFSFNLT